MGLHGALLGPNTVDHYLLDERMLDLTDQLFQTFEAHPVPVTTTTLTSDIAKETQVHDVIEDTEGDVEPF